MKLAIEPPDGFHWMDTPDGPKLMPGDYQPHEGAVERYDSKLSKPTKRSKSPGRVNIRPSGIASSKLS